MRRWLRAKWRDHQARLAESQRQNREWAYAAGYCTCPAGELGAVCGEEHEPWCAHREVSP